MLAGVLAKALASFNGESGGTAPLAALPPAPLPALLPALFRIWPDSDSVPGRQDPNSRYKSNHMG